jgi:hypothetical protein
VSVNIENVRNMTDVTGQDIDYIKVVGLKVFLTNEENYFDQSDGFFGISPCPSEFNEYSLFYKLGQLKE